jgi:hypothetical protein
MPAECSAAAPEFTGLNGRSVVAAFDGGAITSDAGALLLEETDRSIGLVERFAACFKERRRPEQIEHEIGSGTSSLASKRMRSSRPTVLA